MTLPVMSSESVVYMQSALQPMRNTLQKVAQYVDHVRTTTVHQLAAGGPVEDMPELETDQALRLMREVRRKAKTAHTPEQVLQVWSLFLRALDLEDIAVAVLAFVALSVCPETPKLSGPPELVVMTATAHLGTGRVHAHAPPVCAHRDNTCVMQT